ncbi:MAG: YebC/PmpR family DNA-binding transcriptional regulator [Bdellovibrionota bacterium]
MGRIFEKRKARMFARWAKNAKAFTKLGKEIAIAVKLGGADPDGNPRLRMAIQTAKSLNMPKATYENAIHRASSKDQASLAEVNYEGYGPYGIAIFVETATDNPTRTVANVRSIFNKYGGAFGTAGSLDYLFARKGVFTIERPKGDPEELELELIDFGLEELFETDDGFLIYSSFEDFGTLQRALESRNIEVKSAMPQRIPLNKTQLSPEQEAEVQKLIDALEEDEDVQHVYHTMESSEG